MRRIANKQRMVTQAPGKLALLFDAFAAFFHRNSAYLSRTGFTAHPLTVIIELRTPGRTAGLVDNRIHALFNQLQIGRRYVYFLNFALFAVRNFQKCRLNLITAVNQPRGHRRQLQGRGQNISLPDTGNQAFTLLPRLAKTPEFPLLVRNQTGFLVFQTDVDFRTETETTRHIGNFFDSQFLSRFIEENIAGMLQRLNNVKMPVSFFFQQ